MSGIGIVTQYETLSKELAAVLSTQTGDVWSCELQERGGSPRYPHRQTFDGAYLIRQKDNLRLLITKMWNKDRIEISVLVPRNKDGSARSVIPGFSYGERLPTTTADPARPADSVIKQMMKTVLSDRIEKMMAAIIAQDKMAADSKTASKVWHDAVAEAAGLQCVAGMHDSIRWTRNGAGYGLPWEIKSNQSYPGGSITMKLPDDPAKAAAIMTKLREIESLIGE